MRLWKGGIGRWKITLNGTYTYLLEEYGKIFIFIFYGFHSISGQDIDLTNIFLKYYQTQKKICFALLKFLKVRLVTYRLHIYFSEMIYLNILVYKNMSLFTNFYLTNYKFRFFLKLLVLVKQYILLHNLYIV